MKLIITFLLLFLTQLFAGIGSEKSKVRPIPFELTSSSAIYNEKLVLRQVDEPDSVEMVICIVFGLQNKNGSVKKIIFRP